MNVYDVQPKCHKCEKLIAAAKGDAEIGWVHLYAQNYWHSPAAIVGDEEGLTKLRNAIDQALSCGSGGVEVFTADGVVCTATPISEQQLSEEF
jgi:hypothetical protein